MIFIRFIQENKTMICSFKLQLAFWFIKPVFEFQVYITLNISVTI